MTTEPYSELDRIDLTPIWKGNQKRRDGSEYATYNMGETTVGIHVLWNQGIYPDCEICKRRPATKENGLCSICERERGKE